jgi:hypothetical protein
MMQAHHEEEAGWLARMDTAPDSCGTTVAREGLRRAGALARDLGFPAVADWVEDFLGAAD